MKKKIRKTEFYKSCSMCGKNWMSRDEFLEDPNVQLVGYQAHFEELTAGLFLFNHSCETTLSIHAEDFADLYHGAIFPSRATGNKYCPGLCLHENNLEPCQIECECAYVREILQLIRNGKKHL